MEKMKKIAGPLIYALSFVLLLPYFLIVWAEYTEGLITYPPVFSVTGGIILMGTGIGLMLWAMAALKIYGKGLPMNAYPPPKYVEKGPYRVIRHPIYLGFTMLVVGYFVYKGSASGLWLVTPVTVLSMIALVWGYESKDLKDRFPGQPHRTLLDLNLSSDQGPAMKDRLVTIFWVLFPLMLYNFLLLNLSATTITFWGNSWSWDLLTETPGMNYIGVIYLVWVAVAAKRIHSIREWRRSALLTLAMGAYILILFPEAGLQHLNPATASEMGSLLSIPVYLLLLGMWQLRKAGFFRVTITGILGVTAVLYQLSQTPSAVLHLGLSFLIFLGAAFYDQIWVTLRKGAEWVANSWTEWRIGKIRVINHGFYVGFAAFFGILTAGILTGPGYAWGLLVFSIVVVVFSALWAQLVEGSEKLKRPYGYYGALVGILFGSGAVWAMGLNAWLIIGVASVVMPWVQGIGRLRCLINGCCHGHIVDDPHIGIRYFHPRSRVCGISNLRAEFLHPTPLYAIIWLFLVGFVLLELWLNGFAAPFLFGLYLILTGLGRFVEEAFRGEVQTSIIMGLRLYQWTAILSIFIGIAMTFIQIEVTAPAPVYYPEILIAALAGGLFVFTAMGVDFPESDARFSRLV